MIVSTVGVITLVGAISIALIAWFVATRRSVAAIEDVRPGVYRIRRNYFFALTTVLIGALLVTLQFMPYDRHADEPVALTLVANGTAWSWAIAPHEPDLDGGEVDDGKIVVPVGRPVRFDVGALDVNHGFGVYTPDGRLLGQVQAMPGYRNQLTLTFPEPGTYEVLCMEYCGLGHHLMFASLEAR